MASTRLRSPGSPIGRAALVTVLVMQIIIGYEWLSSGISKIASGDFASGLAGDLRNESGDAASWYRSFLNGTVIPHGHLFGVLIMWAEVLVGIGLIGAAIVWLWRWPRLSDDWRIATLACTMLASFGAIFMAANFHLASGGNHPWLIPASGFDETIDVDSVLIMLQLLLILFCAYVLRQIHQQNRAIAKTTGTASAAAPVSS